MAQPFAAPNLNREFDNLPEAFRSFKQYCCLIFDGPFSKKPEKERVTYLLLWIGRRGRDIYDGWRWDYEDEKYSLNKVWQRFELHIEQKVNPYLAHYNFQQCRQTADATVDDFISRCRVIIYNG